MIMSNGMEWIRKKVIMPYLNAETWYSYEETDVN